MFTALNRSLYCVLFMMPVLLLAQRTDDTGTTIFKDGQNRYIITAREQNQTAELRHLKPGESYVLVIPPDFALGSCIPDVTIVEPTALQSSWSSAQHALSFTATSTTVRIRMHYPCSWQENDPPRHYVSLSCLSCQPESENQNLRWKVPGWKS